MFKTLYYCPRTIARHENGPLCESRRAYLEHLAAQGSSRKTLRVASEFIYCAAVHMRLDHFSQVERSDVELAAKDWATRPYGNGNQIGPVRVMKRFRLVVCSWLRFAGRLHEIELMWSLELLKRPSVGAFASGDHINAATT